MYFSAIAIAKNCNEASQIKPKVKPRVRWAKFCPPYSSVIVILVGAQCLRPKILAILENEIWEFNQNDEA
jgi:hypothetical protein